MTREEAVTQAQQGHRNYAKRQMTWFRREPEMHWLAGLGGDDDVATEARGWSRSFLKRARSLRQWSDELLRGVLSSEKLAIDTAALEKQFYALSRKLHPGPLRLTSCGGAGGGAGAVFAAERCLSHAEGSHSADAVSAEARGRGAGGAVEGGDRCGAGDGGGEEADCSSGAAGGGLRAEHAATGDAGWPSRWVRTSPSCGAI